MAKKKNTNQNQKAFKPEDYLCTKTRLLPITATVADCLRYLDMVGWSELIDTRWRRQIEKDLRLEFGDSLSEETLSKAVSVVLYPDKELQEEKYEFLDQEDCHYREFIEHRKIETGWNQRNHSDQGTQH